MWQCQQQAYRGAAEKVRGGSAAGGTIAGSGEEIKKAVVPAVGSGSAARQCREWKQTRAGGAAAPRPRMAAAVGAIAWWKARGRCAGRRQAKKAGEAVVRLKPRTVARCGGGGAEGKVAGQCV